MDCVEMGRKYGIFVIVDGGFKYLGDVVKVLVVGVLVVMMGLLFVGCEEVLGEMEIY